MPLQDSTANEEKNTDDDEEEEELPEDENSDVDLDSRENKHSSDHDDSISEVF